MLRLEEYRPITIGHIEDERHVLPVSDIGVELLIIVFLLTDDELAHNEPFVTTYIAGLIQEEILIFCITVEDRVILADRASTDAGYGENDEWYREQDREKPNTFVETRRRLIQLSSSPIKK